MRIIGYNYSEKLSIWGGGVEGLKCFATNLNTEAPLMPYVNQFLEYNCIFKTVKWYYYHNIIGT